ncbi:efflux RND transporter periplasmic adaptor subunit [Thalassobius sp. Cn5-15]|uniref:efflux RND transporter periplasmic adaptor subunit n=1 Tax=Thalassobius sp. Cn5-15 TaxID=2917763 RepID=UPI001EF3B807|nr:efflux RND transporter periplasmic adaptor subunit [Thalassobius sp. Cn5-15]MCG7492538.1 efflux RND transporter periplasmic adaptor subunit [Thalassobius sp. Cn5-15]
MRIVPLLTAIIVTVTLYVLIMERQALLAFARGEPAVTEADTTALPAPDSTEMKAIAQDLVRVVVQTTEAREIDSAVQLRGETEAARQVDVMAETSATVISEPLRRGSFVEAGQALCTLAAGTRPAVLAQAEANLLNAQAQIPQTEARLREAEARLDEARINDNVATKLSETGYASDTRVAATQAAVVSAQAGVEAARSGLETTQAGIRGAEAAVAAAQKEMERLVITAPFAGLLETDTAELGSLMAPGATCATVLQLDPIKVVGYVAETQVNRVTLGALAGARLADGREVRGRVTFLSRSADPQTRTFRVDIDVANTDMSIRDGQTADILIASAGKRAHLIPASAMTLNDAGDLGVRVLGAENIVTFKPITLLRDTTDGVWITGLAPREDLIVVGQEYVIDGVKVLPTYREASHTPDGNDAKTSEISQ